jgi:hypothetical protein
MKKNPVTTRQSKSTTILNVYIPAFIGAYTGLGVPSNFFNGIIDDVRIYNQMLRAEEIQKIYQDGVE